MLKKKSFAEIIMFDDFHLVFLWFFLWFSYGFSMASPRHFCRRPPGQGFCRSMELDDEAKRAVLEAPQEVQRRILAEVRATGDGGEMDRNQHDQTWYIYI